MMRWVAVASGAPPIHQKRSGTYYRHMKSVGSHNIT